MKKRVVVIFCLLTILASGCSGEINRLDVAPEEYTVDNLELVQISSSLWYDKNTNIVYIWNGWLSQSSSATTPTPYIATNGLPYKYDLETKSLVEIDPVKEWGLDKLTEGIR